MPDSALLIELPHATEHNSHSDGSSGFALGLILLLLILFLLIIGLIVAYCVWWRPSNNNSKRNKPPQHGNELPAEPVPHDPQESNDGSHPNEDFRHNELNAADYNW